MTAALILTSASHTIACASCNAPWPREAAQCPGCGLREEAPVATQVVAPSYDALRAQLAAVTAERDALHYVLRHAMLSHPLPWRVEQDWTWEVTAADGAIVAKCQTPTQAQAIVALAEKVAAAMAEADDAEVPA